MKQTKIKNEHYSNLKLVIRIVTLAIALWALIVAHQNKKDLQWLQAENDNIIEKLMFPNSK